MSCFLCSLRQLLQFRLSRGKAHEVCNLGQPMHEAIKAIEGGRLLTLPLFIL
jgi:hypothetical protein